MRKIIIGSGHGFETPGKRSIFHKILFKGKYVARFRENEFNEAICNKFSVLYDNSVFISNEWFDVSLSNRMKREHLEFTPDSIFISIHADAFKKKDVAKGGRFYYYSYAGKKIAEYLTKYFIANGYDLDLRPVKRANFYVLKNSLSPAVLFEAGFMTTASDLKYLESENFRNKTANLLNSAFRNIPIKL